MTLGRIAAVVVAGLVGGYLYSLGAGSEVVYVVRSIVRMVLS